MASDIKNEAIEWLAKLNRDSLSAAEEAAFFAWLQQSDIHQAAYVKAEQLWLRGDAIARAANVRPAARAAAGFWLGGLAVACCLAFALMLFWPRSPEYIQLSADAEMVQFTLPDGSEVTLKPQAQLAYAFEKNLRNIHLLQGEVFFDVTHNPLRPFVVITRFGAVRVLGTQFSVGLGEQDAQVLVLSGKVEVQPEAAEQKTVLIHNQAVSFQQVANGQAPQAVKAGQALSWRNRQWVFENTPLAEAVATIESALGLPISVPQKLAALPVTGVLPMSKPLQALNTLASSHGLMVVPTADGYQLQKKP